MLRADAVVDASINGGGRWQNLAYHRQNSKVVTLTDAVSEREREIEREKERERKRERYIYRER
jgi:hypothetical protein